MKRTPLLVALLWLQQVVGWSNDVPFWPHYPSRSVNVLDGKWDFGLHFDVKDVLALQEGDLDAPNSTTVPSAFDVTPGGVQGPRGTAIYRTTCNISAGLPSLLHFSACSFYCKVWVDGTEVGEHRAGGYAPFELQVPASASTQRSITVLVDNRFNSTIAPLHTGGDFYHYGGITRSVLWHELPASGDHIKRLEILPQRTGSNWTIDLAVFFTQGSDTRAEDSSPVSLSLGFDGFQCSVDSTVLCKATLIRATGDYATSVCYLPGLTLPSGLNSEWSPESPSLHTLKVCASFGTSSSAKDEVEARFGLRDFKASDDGHLLLNGRRIRLHGTNRHQMWPETGSALSAARLDLDLNILKDLRVNMLRGGHYPQVCSLPSWPTCASGLSPGGAPSKIDVLSTRIHVWNPLYGTHSHRTRLG